MGRRRTPPSATCAVRATSQLLSLPVTGADSMPWRRRLVLGAPETNELESGLLAVFRCNDDFGVSVVASLSPFLGTLFDWSLSFLHYLRHQFVTRNSAAEAERTLQCELEEASQQLSGIQAREEQVVEKAFRALRESGTSISTLDACNQFSDVVVLFSKGSTLTSSLALRALAGPTELLLKHGELRLFIEGHQSSDEAADLAQKRAHTINKYLRARGVARERLSIIDAGAIGEGAACVKLSVMKPLSPSISRYHPFRYWWKDTLIALQCGLAMLPCLRVGLSVWQGSCRSWVCQKHSSRHAGLLKIFLFLRILGQKAAQSTGVWNYTYLQGRLWHR